MSIIQNTMPIHRAIPPWTHHPAIYGLDEVLDFAAHEFCRMVERIDGFIDHYRNEPRAITDEGYAHISRTLDFIIRTCINIELSQAVKFVERSKIDINTGTAGTVVAERMKAIRILIYDELEQRKFLYVKNNKAALLGHVEDDWRIVFDTFKNTREDAVAATESYAFELNNACVFHSMMVLERGLVSLAKAVKTDTNRDSWETIIGRIERAIYDQFKAAKTTPPGTKPLSPRAADVRRKKLEVCLF